MAELDPEREPVLGIGIQAGPIRIDYGPNHAQLECDVCHATWIGEIGDWCNYCTTWNENAANNHNFPTTKPSTNGHKGGMAGDAELSAMLIDWPKFWAKDHTEAEWLAEPLIPAGRSVALFAPGGTGKSLLALWLAAAIATGTSIFGTTQPPRRVLYLDYEMTEDDLAERLETMGYANADLTNLHYALLPSLPGLDQQAGGEAVLRLAELVDSELVIIDTFGRAVHGDENDADTVRAWYRWTGIHLKNAGRAFLRVDHAGKDLTKGQRGSSAKNDDVDVVWQMTVRDDNSYTLTAKKRRMGWIPERVDLHLDDTDDLTFTLLNAPPAPPGTGELATLLDELGADINISARAAGRLLRDNGHQHREIIIRAAVKYRKQAVENLLQSASQSSGRTPPSTPRPDNPDAHHQPKPNPLLDDLGRDAGRGGTHLAGATDGGCVTRSGTHSAGAAQPQPPQEPTFDPLEDF